MSVGRQKNADPRWLLPLICRLGHLTKKDIGAIRIFDRESRFEIAEEAVERFNAALTKAGKDEVRIRPTPGLSRTSSSSRGLDLLARSLFTPAVWPAPGPPS